MIKKLIPNGTVYLKPNIQGKHLKKHEGKPVCVFWSVKGNDRHGFHTTVSVLGELEVHPENKDSYRVLADDDTYAYFTLKDVGMIAQAGDGRRPNIALRCEQDQ